MLSKKIAFLEAIMQKQTNALSRKWSFFFFYPPEVGTHLFTRLIYFTCGFNISFFF